MQEQVRKNSNTSADSGAEIRADHFLDITGETCPLTFVKTKLLIERAAPGAVIEIRLKGREPLDNVPRSVRDHGHSVLALVPEQGADKPAGPESPHRLLIRKEGSGA